MTRNLEFQLIIVTTQCFRYKHDGLLKHIALIARIIFLNSNLLFYWLFLLFLNIVYKRERLLHVHTTNSKYENADHVGRRRLCGRAGNHIYGTHPRFNVPISKQAPLT